MYIYRDGYLERQRVPEREERRTIDEYTSEKKKKGRGISEREREREAKRSPKAKGVLGFESRRVLYIKWFSLFVLV
jgi:hypothetical protein